MPPLPLNVVFPVLRPVVLARQIWRRTPSKLQETGGWLLNRLAVLVGNFCGDVSGATRPAEPGQVGPARRTKVTALLRGNADGAGFVSAFTPTNLFQT
jgi:hypothetical protein